MICPPLRLRVPRIPVAIFTSLVCVFSCDFSCEKSFLALSVTLLFSLPEQSISIVSFLREISSVSFSGMGDVACNVVFAITSSLLVYFYTNVAGVSAALVGTILLASRIFDGVSDLMMAQITDKVNSPLGKYRSWVLWMAIPYAVSAVLLVCVPGGSSTTVQAVISSLLTTSALQYATRL